MATDPAQPPAGPAQPPAGRLQRFDATERFVHWSTAILFAVLALTGSALYLQPVGAIFGRRHLVEEVHVYSGIALAVPVLIGLAGPWGRQLRADFGRFNRWSVSDKAWLAARLRGRRATDRPATGLPVGKFNAGQKLNAAWTAGAGIVMLATGLIMRFYSPWPLSWRTGATFVHDWLAFAMVVVVAGHVGMALRHPEAFASMRTGWVSRDWAKRNAPAWLDGADGKEGSPDKLRVAPDKLRVARGAAGEAEYATGPAQPTS